MISHSELVKETAIWLKKHSQNIYVPNCSIIITEAYSLHAKEIPDVLGWSFDTSVLIEVKVSRSDFLNDKKKSFKGSESEGVGKLRLYCCPEFMIKETDLPSGWGLLYWSKDGIKIIKRADRKESNLHTENSILLSLIRKEKNKTRSDKIDLLDSYSKFLEKNGYTDVDWRAEEPYAIDEYLKFK